MRKQRLYLDTSVISDIDAPQESIRGRITKEFFRIVVENPEEYELVISPTTLEEIQESPEVKRALLVAFLDSISHTELPKNPEAENLAWIYVIEDVLSDNHIDDLKHVAYAVTARCDYIISWNMRHMVNPRTIARVNEVNVLENFSRIILATPLLITGEFPHVND